MDVNGMRRVAAAATCGTLALLLAAGCGEGGREDAAGRAGDATAVEQDDALLREVEDVQVPTAEEATRRAEETIDENNADDEYERLRQEIEGDG